LFDFGVAEDTAWEMLTDWNEQRCWPPLDDDDIERIIKSAQTNRNRAIGSDHPDASSFEPVAIAPRASTVSGAWPDEPADLWAEDAEPVDLPPGVVPPIVERYALDRSSRLAWKRARRQPFW